MARIENPGAVVGSVIGERELRLWHHRLGHVPYPRLKKMFRNCLVRGMSIERSLLSTRAPEMGRCEVCERSHRKRRTYRAKYVDQDPRTVAPAIDGPLVRAVYIVCDWLVLVNCPSRDGYLYVLMLADVPSRRTWGYRLRRSRSFHVCCAVGTRKRRRRLRAAVQ